MERLGNDYGLYVYHMFARYSCLHPSGEPVVYRTLDGNREVRVSKTVGLQEWKAFMYVLWKGEPEREDEEGIVFYVDMDDMRALLGEPHLSAGQMKEILLPLREVHYDIKERTKTGVVHRDFGLIYRIEGFDGDDGRAYLKLYVDKRFYEFCVESGLFYYVWFIRELKSPYAVNLLSFFVANEDKQKFTEETLFERLNLVNYPDFKKRQIVKDLLGMLKEVGYLKGYDYSNGIVSIERYDRAYYRAKAVEKAKELQRHAEQYLKRAKEKKREINRAYYRKRKSRQREEV